MKKANKILASAMALTLIAGALPVTPLADIFSKNAITASAEESVPAYTLDKEMFRYVVKSNGFAEVVFTESKNSSMGTNDIFYLNNAHDVIGARDKNNSKKLWVYCSSKTNKKVLAPADSSYLFDDMYTITSIDCSGLDTSNVTDMNGMFERCPILTSLDLSGFDTSNVTMMASMFACCRNLTSLDLSGFDTSKVTYMIRMFQGCNANNLSVIGIAPRIRNQIEYLGQNTLR